jgi:translation initiation factor RLI1
MCGLEFKNPILSAAGLGCGMCVGQCPEDAIKLVHLATGNVVWENRGLHPVWVKD